MAKLSAMDKIEVYISDVKNVLRDLIEKFEKAGQGRPEDCYTSYTKIVVPANIDEQKVLGVLMPFEEPKKGGGTRIWDTKYEFFEELKTSKSLFIVYGVVSRFPAENSWFGFEDEINDALKWLRLYRYKPENMPDSETFLDNYPKYASQEGALPTFANVVLWYEFLLKLSAESNSHIEATPLEEPDPYWHDLPPAIKYQILKTDIYETSIYALQYLLEKATAAQSTTSPANNKEALRKLTTKPDTAPKRKKTKRRKSAKPTPRQEEAYALTHVRRLTLKQAGLEMGCTPQCVSKLLKIAEEKAKADYSPSIDSSKIQNYPHDKRGNVMIDETNKLH